MSTSNVVKKSFLETQAQRDNFALCGLSYRDTAVELRERFAVPGERTQEVLRQVLSHPQIEEAVLVTTCNRTELITASSQGLGQEVAEHLEGVFAGISGLTRAEFSQQVYHLQQQQVIEHLFRVASGLDSMVLGEPQVLGQLKSAFRLATQCGATRQLLHRLFDRAFGVAKNVRTETKIGHSAVSVCYAARELARQIFGDLTEASVMMIGAGATGALALKHFRAAGVSKFFIANRSIAKAAELAHAFSGVALELDALAKFLDEADIVIGASSRDAEQSYFVELELINRSRRDYRANSRWGRPQFYIDLGVPRNFSPGIADDADVFLYDIDDLQGIVAKNMDARAVEVERAQILVSEEVQRFSRWMETRSLFPVIRRVKQRFTQIEDGETARTMRRLQKAGFSAEQLELIEEALQDSFAGLRGKVLHGALITLKERALTEPDLLEVFEQFFLEPLRGQRK